MGNETYLRYEWACMSLAKAGSQLLLRVRHACMRNTISGHPFFFGNGNGSNRSIYLVNPSCLFSRACEEMIKRSSLKYYDGKASAQCYPPQKGGVSPLLVNLQLEYHDTVVSLSLDHFPSFFLFKLIAVALSQPTTQSLIFTSKASDSVSLTPFSCSK